MTLQIVELNDSESGARARILASFGFNCFSWMPVLNDGPREMLWAEEAFEAGDKRPSRSGIPLLFPFPGRIGGAAFEFQGRHFELEANDGLGNAIHGFVHNRPWRVVEQTASRVVGEFQASKVDRKILERWPSDFRIQVSYELHARELVSHIRYENAGDGPLPCGFGAHAYFRLPLSAGGSVADTILVAPIREYWGADGKLPSGRVLPVQNSEEWAKGLRLGEQDFDIDYTGLQLSPDGLFRTQLIDPASGRTLTQTFDTSFTQCVVFTPPHREAICMEPYTCVPDAFRLGAQGCDTGLEILTPGEPRERTIRIEIKD
jgi:aldose 1-epimerase